MPSARAILRGPAACDGSDAARARRAPASTIAERRAPTSSASAPRPRSALARRPAARGRKQPAQHSPSLCQHGLTAALRLAYVWTLQRRRRHGCLIWSRLDFEGNDRHRNPCHGPCLVGLGHWHRRGPRRLPAAACAGPLSGRHPGLGTCSIVRAFGLRPSIDDIERLLDPVLDAIRKTTDPDQLQALAQAVQTLGPSSPEQAQAALGPVLDAIRQTTDLYQLQALAQAVQTLGPSSPPSRPRPPSDPSSTPSAQTTDPYQLQALAQAVQTLGPTPEQAQAALGPVLDAIRKTTDPDQLQALAQAVQTLGPKLTPEQAQAALGPVLDAIRRTTALPAPGPGPGGPDPRPQARARAGPGRPRPSSTPSARPPTLTSSRPWPRPSRPSVLAPEQAQAALGPVLDAIRQTTNPDQLRPWPRPSRPSAPSRASRPRPPSAPSSTPSAGPPTPTAPGPGPGRPGPRAQARAGSRRKRDRGCEDGAGDNG